jgi:hypothetical protein
MEPLQTITTTKKVGGARPGAGRKKGILDPNSKKYQILKTKQAIEKQITKKTAPLIRAALITALGQTFVYKVEEQKIGKGPKGGEYTKRVHTLVTDPREIETALNKMEDGGQDPDDEYYYVTTKEPDHRAVEMLLNRLLGRPKEMIEMTGTFSLLALGKHAIDVMNDDGPIEADATEVDSEMLP